MDSASTPDDESTRRARVQAFHGALAAVAERFEAHCGRKPTTEQLLEALSLTLIARDESSSADEPDATAEDAASTLARWRACPPWVRPTRRPRVKDGDVIHIPYAAHGARAILGRVLYAPSKGREGPGYGLCLLVIDKDAPDDLLEQPSDERLAELCKGTPKLLRPYHPGTQLFKDGLWTVLGNVPFEDPDRLLPCFAVHLLQEQRDIIRDYWGAEVPNTPENQARVVPPSVGGAGTLVRAIRALRGLTPWRARFGELLPPKRSSPA